MLEEKIKVARTISLGINTLERKGNASLDQSLALVSSIIAARNGHNMPLTFATAAISRATAAAAHIAEANHQLAECHRHLAADQIEFGVPHMFGVNSPCPTFAQESSEPVRASAKLHLAA